MEKLLQFVAHHWLLSAAFVVALMVLIVVEARSKGVGGASRLSVIQLTQLINHEQALIVDIRDAVVFNDGHIVNAINIPFVDFDQNAKRLEKDKQRPIVIVCATGQKSAVVMNKLKKQGFEKVYLLVGGMTAWSNASMPVKK